MGFGIDMAELQKNHVLIFASLYTCSLMFSLKAGH